jgi:cytochrome c-type biogenesis protein CcmH
VFAISPCPVPGRAASDAADAPSAGSRVSERWTHPGRRISVTTLRASAVVRGGRSRPRCPARATAWRSTRPITSSIRARQFYERLGSWDQALDAYRSAGRLAPNSAEVQHRVGIACRALGHTDAALVALREAALADPGNLAILADLGDTLTAAGFPAEAVEIWREVAQRRPSDGPTLVQLGAAQRRAGEPQAARETLERARAQCPDDPRIWLELGLAAQALARPARPSRRSAGSPARPSAAGRDAARRGPGGSRA